MKSTATVIAYLLCFAVTSQLLFSAPCSGALGPISAIASRTPAAPSPQKASVNAKPNSEDKNQVPNAELVKEVKQIASELKKMADVADKIESDINGILPAIKMHHAPASSGESPDLLDQLKNLLIKASVWSITTLFTGLRTIFNWFASLGIFWSFAIILLILICRVTCNCRIIAAEAAAAEKALKNKLDLDAQPEHPLRQLSVV